MRRTRLAPSWLSAALLPVALVALLACDGGEDATPEATSTATPPTATTTSTAMPTGTPAGTPSPTPSPTPQGEAVEVLETLWLVDASDGAVELLAETAGYVLRPRFLDEGQAVAFTVTMPGQGDTDFAVDLSGHPWDVPPELEPERPEVCAELSCAWGPSPDGRYLVYTTPLARDSLAYAYGVLDLVTGEQTEIRDDLVHCGGCDGRYGAEWSPSGRYFAIAEYGGDGRVFLADVERMEDRPVGFGNEVTMRPEWSPEADILVLAGQDTVSLVHPDTAEEWPLDLDWPVRWEATGRYLYSPAWGIGGITRVFDMDTGQVEELPGTPPSVHLWTQDVALVGLEDGGFTAALEDAPDCQGVRVTSPLAPTPRCVEGGLGAAISADGGLVAAAVSVGAVTVAGTDSRWPSEMVRQRLVVLDVASGDQVEVQGELVGFAGEPPEVQWHPEGTHLLVRWPAAHGL